MREFISKVLDREIGNKEDSWDSYEHLLIIYKLEKEFNIKFTLDEIVDGENLTKLEKP